MSRRRSETYRRRHYQVYYVNRRRGVLAFESGYKVTGDIAFTVVPAAAGLVYTPDTFAITGDITLTLTPTATFTTHDSIQGDITFTLTPTASALQLRHIVGQIGYHEWFIDPLFDLGCGIDNISGWKCENGATITGNEAILDDEGASEHIHTRVWQPDEQPVQEQSGSITVYFSVREVSSGTGVRVRTTGNILRGQFTEGDHSVTYTFDPVSPETIQFEIVAGFGHWAISRVSTVAPEGSITLTSSIAATMHKTIRPQFQGNLPLNMLPAGTLNFRPGAPFIIGDITWATTPAATMEFHRRGILSGDITFSLTPAATTLDFTRNAAIDGIIPLNVLLAASMDFRKHFSLVGDIPLIWIPASFLLFTQFTPRIIGSVTFTLTPAATGLDHQIHPQLTGDITFTLTPAATALQYSHNIQGDISWTLDPTAAALDFTRHGIIQGSITWTFTPASTIDFREAAKVQGDITWTLVPASVLVSTAGRVSSFSRGGDSDPLPHVPRPWEQRPYREPPPPPASFKSDYYTEDTIYEVEVLDSFYVPEAPLQPIIHPKPDVMVQAAAPVERARPPTRGGIGAIPPPQSKSDDDALLVLMSEL